LTRIARLVLDTSAYSRFRAGHPEVLERIAQADVVHIPSTVLGELYGGFGLGRRERENRQSLAEFLDEAFVSVLPTTPEVAERYGQIYVGLRKRGRPVPVNDMWIAAAVIDCGGHLLTFDSDFRSIGSLSVTIVDA